MGKIYKKTKESYYSLWNYNYVALKREFIFFMIIFISLFLIITGIFGYWSIFFVNNELMTNLIYTVLNALVFGAYLNALGLFNRGIQNKTVYYILVIVVIFLFLSGFGFFDFVIRFNLPIFAYQYFSLSSEHGILFIFFNFYIFFLIYGLSFTFEKELK